MKKVDKVTILKIILVSLSVILIVLTNLLSKDKNEDKKITKDDKYKWKVQEKSDKYLDIYLNNESYMVINNDNFVTSDFEKVGTYYCINNECEVVNYKNNYGIIKDGSYYIYDVLNNKKKLLNIDEINEADIFFDEDKLCGLFVKNKEEKYAYYSIYKNKLLSAFTYNFIKETNVKNYILTKIENNEYLIDYNNFDIKITAEESSIKAYKTNNNLYYVVTNKNNESNIYNEKFEILFDSEYLKEFGISNSGNIALRKDNNSFSIYNSDGLLVKSSKNYKEVNKIIDNYVLVIDTDSSLKLIDYDGNVINNMLNINDKIVINWAESGYANNEYNTLNIYYVDKTDESNIKNMQLIFDIKTAKKEVKELDILQNN